jgi:hypothetical protein
MRTPAGFDCKYFYADYYRGRNKQECRLIAENVARQVATEKWTPDLCRQCRAPKILLANACPNLRLQARVVKTWLGLGRQVVVTAACAKTREAVREPEIGCGHCHEALASESVEHE